MAGVASGRHPRSSERAPPSSSTSRSRAARAWPPPRVRHRRVGRASTWCTRKRAGANGPRYVPPERPPGMYSLPDARPCPPRTPVACARTPDIRTSRIESPEVRASPVANGPVVRDRVPDRVDSFRHGGIVWMSRAIRDDRHLGHALQSRPDAWRHDRQRIVVGPEETLNERTPRGGILPVVMQDEFYSAPDTRVVERHHPVPMPTFDDIAVD